MFATAWREEHCVETPEPREESTGRTDFLVGLFILGSLGVIIGALVLTSGVLEGRYDIYMRVATAQGLSQDTRVILQGLPIGRVKHITPQLDPSTNALHFIATLSVRERFPDGTRLVLPAGTRAVISHPTAFVVSPVVDLIMPPPSPTEALLQPGDTIDSERIASVLDAMADIASTLSTDITETLDQTRELVSRSTRTMEQTGALLSRTSPQLVTTLQRLGNNLDRADRILAAIEPRVGPLADSVVATLADTRKVVLRLDSLANTAYGMANDNRFAITEAIKHLHRSALILENFAEQLSRRPLRMLTGITPPADTADDHR